ncbi:MAG: HD domain-containing phosphohydrolase [Polyangiales bacterium]
MDERATLEDNLHKLELLYEVGIALSAEHDTDRLMERILMEAKKLCRADGGTLYMRTEDDHLRFAIVRNDSLGIALGGTTGSKVPFAPIELHDDETQRPNHNNVATYAALIKKSVNIPDAYDTTTFDFSGTKAFDDANGYRSTSFLTIPLVNHKRRVIAVLQLINAQDEDGKTIAFSRSRQRIVEALASQAAVALENQQLIDGQRKLLESFIQMIAAAIDSKSPYTGAHCERVPILTLMLAQAACEQGEGPFGSFNLSEDEWYELKIAAWLHDCGKVTTPVHIMDKGTKLETINDRIETVAARFEVLKRDAKIVMLEAKLSGENAEDAEAQYAETVARLSEELGFLREANVGAEFLADKSAGEIREIGKRLFIQEGLERALLSEDEVDNLCISRGTLTDDERLIINGHMVQTVQMLESLPFPANLRNVPEYAGGHHERFDGKGYPRGLYAGDMSIPARIMAIADVFEALTAQDRPYKKGKTLSESMRIMGFMKRDNHLDPELLDLFVTSGVYKEYGRRYLPPSLIDEVDEEAILAIEPKAFELPPEEQREERRSGFLPRYRRLRGSVMGEIE